MPVPVQKLASLYAFEVARQGFLQLGDYRFALGSSAVSLVDAVATMNIGAKGIKLNLGSLSDFPTIEGVKLSSGLHFTIVTPDTVESPFLFVETDPLSNIQGVVVIKNSHFNLLSSFSHNNLVPASKKSDDFRTNPAVDGVVLRIREFADCFYFSAAKASASMESVDAQSLGLRVRKMEHSKSTVESTYYQLRASVDNFRQIYEQYRPRTQEEQLEVARNYKDRCLGELETLNIRLNNHSVELEKLVAQEEDSRLRYEHFKGAVLAEKANGNITDRDRINSRIPEGRRHVGTEYSTATYAIGGEFEAATKLRRELTDPFGNYRLSSADLTWDTDVTLDKPATVSFRQAIPYDEWVPNSLYTRLEDLLENYHKADSHYKWLLGRKEQLSSWVADIQKEIATHTSVVRKIEAKYHV